MKRAYRAIERAAAAARGRPGPGPSGSDRTTSTGRRCSGAETRCLAAGAPGALRRAPHPPHRWRRIDGNSSDNAPARLPARERHRPRHERGGLTADHRRRGDRRRPARPLRHPRHRPARAGARPRRGPTSSSTWPPTSTSTGRSSTPRSSSTRTCKGAGTSCASPSWPASRPSSSPRRTKRRSLRASTGGRSASWSSSPPPAGRRARARHVAVRFVNVLESTGSASELFLTQARAHVPLTVTETGMGATGSPRRTPPPPPRRRRSSLTRASRSRSGRSRSAHRRRAGRPHLAAHRPRGGADHGRRGHPARRNAL